MTPIYDPDYEPRLYDADGDMEKRWYIDFRIWDTDKKEFVRKQYTGMNKYRSKTARKKKALEKLLEIKNLLKQGATTGDAPKEQENDNLRFDEKKLTLKQAIIYFLNYKNATITGNEEHRLEEKYNEGVARVSKNTFRSYKKLKNVLFEWLDNNNRSEILFTKFNKTVCGDFFTYLKEGRKIENKTYNIYRGYFATVFNHFIDFQDIEIKNPIQKIEFLKNEESEKHPPFSKEQMQMLREQMLLKEEFQLYLFVSFIYYTFTRPGREIRLLRVGDIKEKSIFIKSSQAKNNTGEYVLIPNELEKLIQKFEIRSFPKHYYVFTRECKPGLEPVGKDYFYRRHRKILQELDLEGYSMYGYKHTGALNLYQQTKDILAVKNHCRHSSSTQTDTYLRKYGAMLSEKVFMMV